MATTTTNQAIRIPQSTDDPNIVEDIGFVVSDIEKKLVMVFLTVSDRSTRVPAPVEGMFSFLKDTNTFSYYDGSAWQDVIPDLPTFSSGTTVPNNASGANGDVFFKV